MDDGTCPTRARPGGHTFETLQHTSIASHERRDSNAQTRTPNGPTAFVEKEHDTTNMAVRALHASHASAELGLIVSCDELVELFGESHRVVGHRREVDERGRLTARQR